MIKKKKLKKKNKRTKQSEYTKEDGEYLVYLHNRDRD